MYRAKVLAFPLILILLCSFSLSPARDQRFRNDAAADEHFQIPPTTDNKAYLDYFFPPRTFWQFGTGEIGGIYTNWGTFGIGYVNTPLCDGEICPSFESPENSGLEYLFAGAIWIGGIVDNDTLVSVGAEGWYTGISEFHPPHEGMAFGGVSDHSIWTLFCDSLTNPYAAGFDPFDDRPHIPLNLRVANRAHTWRSDPENYSIIYDMVITNTGPDLIQEGYVGFHIDADVFHRSNDAQGFFDDLTGSLPDKGIAYIIDNDGDPEGGFFDVTSPLRAFAFKFLQASFIPTDTAYNWWIGNGNAALDFGPQRVDEFGSVECDFGAHIGTPTGDPSKYCIMSHPGWDYDQIRTDTIEGWAPPYNSALADDFANGSDTRFLMSIGPFDLMPDSSIRLIYTNFTGADIHTDPDNLTNLPDDPDQYLANLDFTDLIAKAAVTDSLGQSLTNPTIPVMGLYARHNDLDSVVIEWDPWGFAGVDGYEIYLYNIPADSFPYPGVAPPWMAPSESDYYASVDQTYRFVFGGLSPYGVYLVSMANRFGSEAGNRSEPLMLQSGGRPPAPLVDDEFIFTQPGDPAVLSWSEPAGVDVDYYNIYKFENVEAAAWKYYPLYDIGDFSAIEEPRDSFFVNGVQYYYYAMKPYQQIDSQYTSLVDYAADSTVFVVTAVLKSGLETSFSEDVAVFEAPPRNRDILAVICADRRDFIECDSLAAFYDSILQGYDYELYNFKDTVRLYSNGIRSDWWKDLLPYRMVIVDGGLRADAFDYNYLGKISALDGFEKFIWSDGLLAYFGSLIRYSSMDYEASPDYYPVYNDFINRIMGIDSVFRIGIMYYVANTVPPLMDTLAGLVYAEPLQAEIPGLAFDSLRDPCSGSTCESIWPDDVAPSVSTFVTNENATPLHLARTLYPTTSLIEGHTIGIKSETYATTAYAFGFHPWYMKHNDARALVDYLMAQTGEYATGMTAAEVDTIYALDAYSMVPKTSNFYLGNMSGEYTADDIGQSSIVINNSVSPQTIGLMTGHPGFDGSVLDLSYFVRDLILSYGPVWGVEDRPYIISGTMIDGIPFSAAGNLVIIGHTRGDANGDLKIDVGDAVYLINFVFRNGPGPDSIYAGDANCDGEVNVADAVYLINFIFNGGSPPCLF